MVLTVHHLNNSRSQRIVWLLEELGLDYEVERYMRHPENKLGQDDLKALHPLGRSPVLTDGDLTIAESGAIIEYVLQEYAPDRLAPAVSDKKNWVQYKYLLHYAEGSLFTPFLVAFYFRTMSPRDVSDQVFASFASPEVKKHLDFLEEQVQESAFFCGDELTAADIQIANVLEFFEILGTMRERGYPKLARFLDTVHARPAYKRALDVGGEYDLSDFKSIVA